MKLTKKMIDEIRRHTPFLMVGRKANDFKFLSSFGSYTKPNADWSYVVEWRSFQDIPVLVVVRFGFILGAMEEDELLASKMLTALLKTGGTVKCGDSLIKLGSNCRLVRNFMFGDGVVADALVVRNNAGIDVYYEVNDIEIVGGLNGSKTWRKNGNKD